MKALIVILFFLSSPFMLGYTLKHADEIDQIGNRPDYPIGWTAKEWQSVIDCTNEPGNGGDWSCDSCYIAKCHIYHHKIDTAILNYY
jgi:hypothetical protein